MNDLANHLKGKQNTPLVNYYQAQPLLKKGVINCIKVFYEKIAKA